MPSRWKTLHHLVRPARDRWSTRATFVAAAVGAGLGLSALWRFPRLALTYGGGTFVIAYAVAVASLAVPLLVLELGLGQRAQRAAPRAYRTVHRRWEWLGWYATLVGALLSIVSAVVAVWALVFCGDALLSIVNLDAQLPWAQDPAGYFHNRVFGGSLFGQLGLPRFKVLYFLALLWAVFGAWAARGPRALGGVLKGLVLVGVLGTLVVALRTLGAGVFEHGGAVFGLSWALTPDFPRLASVDLWIQAYGQALVCLAVGTGVPVVLARALPREAEVPNTTYFSVAVVMLVSLVSFLAVAALVGTTALADGRSMADTARLFANGAPGVELAFITYPRALVTLPGESAVIRAGVAASLFGALAAFALAFAALGIHASAAALRSRLGWGGLKTGLAVAAGGVAITAVLAGIQDTAWIDALDEFAVTYGVLVVALVESIAIGWGLGTAGMREALNASAERRVGIAWETLVRLATPAVLAFMIVNALMRAQPWGRFGLPADWHPPGTADWRASLVSLGAVGLLVTVAMLAVRRSHRRTRRVRQRRSFTAVPPRQADRPAPAHALAGAHPRGARVEEDATARAGAPTTSTIVAHAGLELPGVPAAPRRDAPQPGGANWRAPGTSAPDTDKPGHDGSGPAGAQAPAADGGGA